MTQDAQQTGRSTLTGRTIRRKPSRRVLLGDVVARRLIAAVGIGGIAAVALVGLFLLWVALPLLVPTGIEPVGEPLPAPGAVAAAPDAAILGQGMDEYASVVWTLFADGTIAQRSLADGSALPTLHLGPAAAPTAFATAGGGGHVAFGFADGTVMTGRLRFVTDYLAPQDVPADLQDLAVGRTRPWRDGLIELTRERQFRLLRLQLELDERLAVGDGPILGLDLVHSGEASTFVAVDSARMLHDRTLSWKVNMLTGERRVRSRGSDFDLATLGADEDRQWLRVLIDGTSRRVVLVARDGTALLLVRGEDGSFSLASRQDLVQAPGAEIGALAWLGGRGTLMVGDTAGGLHAWFPVRGGPNEAPVLARVHSLQDGPAPVTALGTSLRTRIVAAGYGDGTVRLYHVTSGRLLGAGWRKGGGVAAVTIAPREDLILAADADGAAAWRVDAPHPETNWQTLLRPVWYEGYPGPAYVWQSSSGSDSFEPKLSLVPLIFGTLKATFYSLLFGLPIALLAAMHTAEFLHRSVRARVKPVIETMASLPSVVLGFLGALVLAPAIEDVVVQVLAVMVGAPFFVLLFAHGWQMLPRTGSARLEPWRPLGVLAGLATGTAVMWSLGTPLEHLLFAGDVKAWLDGRAGSGVGGWFVLLLPAAAFVVAWANGLWGEPLLRRRGPRWTPLRLSFLDLGRFLVGAAAAVALAAFLGWMLDGVGWDPRGSVFGTYVQRNALVVGVVMGFAIIPIIFSIADDALTAVPDHLRAASLGAGATPWQTLVRVVVPPAVSGLFSAVMIGVGRAVGETMIVLMAAGNTPIMEFNIFNGFRTLSANLAVELPEAVQNSTHYRTLFLAALTLFAMTFVLNTVAEVVRLHFRKKASRL
ncbi:MAG: ABC transporter permease subunit [Candidatus Krumholzibacteriia bacterium]